MWRSVEVSELRAQDLLIVKIFGETPRVDLYHILSAEERGWGYDGFDVLRYPRQYWPYLRGYY